jgi:putative hemolysin
MMKLFTSLELLKAANIKMPGGILIAKALMQILRYNKLNETYTSAYDEDPVAFVDSILRHLDVGFEVSESDLAKLPATGPAIIISNHPFGGIDSLILLKILFSVRKDIKMMGNFLLHKIDPLKDFILPVNPFETRKEAKSSFSGIKAGLSFLEEKHVVAIFPAGEVSTYQTESNTISDREWQKSVLKFIKKAKVPVVPVYFQGLNSRLFYILARIHPLLRTASLPSELFNKKNKTIQVRIGTPVSPAEQSEFVDITRYGRFLRAKTYSLGSDMEVEGFFRKIGKRRLKRVRPVADAIKPSILKAEIEGIRSTHELFHNNTFSVFYAPVSSIPNIFQEIGRLREITFRDEGEGTNKSRDIDEYDLYYNHLFVWDNTKEKIVGSYRVGKGREILYQYGIKGFYISSLFRIKPGFSSYLADSLELGRSFIVAEYQRKPLSLFLLWKGLLIVLMRNPDYRYLIGPVSISNDFSEFSKSLIVKFIKSTYYNSELAWYIKPRKKYDIRGNKTVDTEILLDNANKDIHKVGKVISDVDHGLKLPVLLIKYLEVNGQIIGFNVDPDFNHCLDGLIILDIYKFPSSFVKALSKEITDDSVKTRFGQVKIPV